MPSFDIVSRMNYAELDNAINNTHKAIAARFDFRGSPVEIEVNKKDKKIKITADDTGKLKGVREMFDTAVVKRGISLKTFSWGEFEHALGGKAKCEVKLIDGLEQEKAKQITKMVKESGLKVQASIQGEELRVQGKKIDDLQAVIKLLDASNLGVPLQYVNMKS
jgi:uncharacterized protein YajQ (UPF0234 family)